MASATAAVAGLGAVVALTSIPDMVTDAANGIAFGVFDDLGHSVRHQRPQPNAAIPAPESNQGHC